MSNNMKEEHPSAVQFRDTMWGGGGGAAGFVLYKHEILDWKDLTGFSSHPKLEPPLTGMQISVENTTGSWQASSLPSSQVNGAG